MMNTRRQFLQYSMALGAYAGMQSLLPAYARARSGARMPNALPVLSGNEIELHIGELDIEIDGRIGRAIAVNRSVPAPLIHLREGQDVTIHVTNHLSEDTSIHWHGILLPNSMDGVPGLTFAGIKPGTTFTYQFPIVQNGTYWYHSHSGLQEQSGLYGPLLFEPATPDPYPFDREHVVVLSDWTFENPHKVLAHMKKRAGYYNFQKPTFGSLVTEESHEHGGFFKALGNRYQWGKMRMDPTDIADITGYTYTYLVNGHSPRSNWTALFAPGERVRLRFINASSASFFDVRIPGLSMKVVQADGNNIEPVDVDEFRIAIAETYDVIVEPKADQAYTIFAEAMDRSGYARATLAVAEGLSAAIPARRKRAMRGMDDMGMDMSHMKGMNMSDKKMPDMDMSGMNMSAMDMTGMAHATQSSDSSEMKMFTHGPDHHGPGNSMVAQMAMSRLSEPGIGLGKDGRRVLVYTDLKSAAPRTPAREPDREIELHLTGNMERFMWSFDGKTMSEVHKPILFRYGERIRMILINDTMMEHPIHLHGMFFELENGSGLHNPIKHTVIVKPAERLSYIVDADAPGLWAFHCHVLYHMAMGMMRAVEVKKEEQHA